MADGTKNNAFSVTGQQQLRDFTAIHKSSPMASWDSKVSIECTLQNLTTYK